VFSADIQVYDYISMEEYHWNSTPTPGRSVPVFNRNLMVFASHTAVRNPSLIRQLCLATLWSTLCIVGANLQRSVMVSISILVEYCNTPEYKVAPVARAITFILQPLSLMIPRPIIYFPAAVVDTFTKVLVPVQSQTSWLLPHVPVFRCYKTVVLSWISPITYLDYL